MTFTVPTTEPARLRQGDSWKWRRDDLGFDPTAWSLVYHFRNAASFFDVTASADAGGFLVTVAPAVSVNHSAGEYHWTAFVSDGIDRHQVGSGVAVVEFDVSAQVAHDARGFAEIMVDALEAALQGKATREQYDIISAASQDASSARDPNVMRADLNRWRLEAKRQRGQGGLRRILTRLPG